jgi:cytochrome c oxidase assembly protein subunit 11
MRDKRKTRLTLGALLLVLGCMVALVVASVPLYRLFCAATGYNGTTQRAESAPTQQVADRLITVRFDATTSPELPWDFRPEVGSVQVHPGETKTVAYYAHNRSNQTLVGTATFNVTPNQAGLYFDKLQCFCFTRQVLAPGQTEHLTVTFFVDPDIVADAEAKDIDTITLSYTMFRAKDQDAPGPTAAVSSPASTIR